MKAEDFEKMKARAEAAGKHLRTDEDAEADAEYWRNRPNLAEWLNAKAEATLKAVAGEQEPIRMVSKLDPEVARMLGQPNEYQHLPEPEGTGR